MALQIRTFSWPIFFGVSGRFLKIKLAINCMQQQMTDKLGAKTRAAYSKHQRKMR